MYLRCFCGDCPKDRRRWLSWAEFCYNTSFHSSSYCTPYQAVYGRTPPILSYVLGSSKVEEIDELLKNRDQILADLELQLQKAQFHMKQNFDRNWKELLFVEGDLVL